MEAMMRYYNLSKAAVQTSNTTANTERAVFGLPIANTTGLSPAMLDSVVVCQGQEAKSGVQIQVSVVRVALADIPSGGTALGTAVPLDHTNSRAAVVGASTSAKYAYADAAVSNTTVLGVWTFNSDYGLIMPPSICNKFTWGPNQALLFLQSHGSGSAALKLNWSVNWAE
jgi:hypothetical protein